MEDTVDTLAGAKFFSTLDFVSAYHAFEIHTDDGRKQLSLQSRGTGNGNVFRLGFVTQLLSLCGRLPVS